MIPDRNLGSVADAGELVPSFLWEETRIGRLPWVRGWFTAGRPGRYTFTCRARTDRPPKDSVPDFTRMKNSAIGFRRRGATFPSRSSEPPGNANPCLRWKARSLLRCGRPTDGAVEAFGSTRRDSCESVTLRCGGRLKRPPITFHPLRFRARPRPTLLRAPLPIGTARHFANRVNVRKRLSSR